MQLTEIQIKKIKTIILVTLSVCLIVYLSFIFANILAILIVSILFSMIINPVVDFLEKGRIHRTVSVLIVFITVGALIFNGVSFLMPKIVNQLNNLGGTLSQENLELVIGKFEKTLKHSFPFLNSVNFVQKVTSFLQNVVFNWVNNISEIFYSIVSVIAILVIIPFMSFFLLKDNKRLMRGIINIMPNKYFEVSYSVVSKITYQLGRFVRGWIFDASAVGILSGIGLAILGIDNAVSIGFIAGIGHLVPYFGPVIGGIPAIIISIIQFGDFSMIPSILIMFACIYAIDNGFIQPNVFSKSTDMHPLVIILLILIGSETLGVFGMLLAVPTATVVKTAAREIYLGYKNYQIIRA